jgi:hypothetical protein
MTKFLGEANEELIYWLVGGDSFIGYFRYMCCETANSCPPLSYIFACCNIANLPCLYTDFRNNSQKIIASTNQSLIYATMDEPCCCCFQPVWDVQKIPWSNAKFIGSKQEYVKMARMENQTSASPLDHIFFSNPRDILILIQHPQTGETQSIWIDFIYNRHFRVEELKKHKLNAKYKKASPQQQSDRLTKIDGGGHVNIDLNDSGDDLMHDGEIGIALSEAKNSFSKMIELNDEQPESVQTYKR